MLRRLYHEQPESFAFTKANHAWAEGEISKYPEGRQASAVIALLWRAQEQEGWLTRAAIEHVAGMLGMDFIRALEVATFYFMFHLHPVGRLAHFQICGTTPCMLCGSEDLIAVCQDKIAANPHELSKDGNFSWEEVECLGACANAPMAQIGKDYYEDLTPESFAGIIDDIAAGKVPTPGSQIGRFASEPKSGLTSLTAFEDGRMEHNLSVERALAIGDTLKRIDGTEIPLQTPWQDKSAMYAPAKPDVKFNDEPVEVVTQASLAAVTKLVTGGAAKTGARKAGTPAGSGTSKSEQASDKATASGPVKPAAPAATGDKDAPGSKPKTRSGPRKAGADDLKQLKGVGPKLEVALNEAGFYHLDQVAAWTDDEIAWVEENVDGAKGRVSRDDWVEQARQLAKGK